MMPLVKYMRTFSQRPDKFVFSVIIMILFTSTIWNLTLSGTSSYNATSNCGVFVIVDGVRPYQKTTPVGQTGEHDYSKWKYTFTPAYAGTVREGINRITAKLLCQAYPANLTKFYSINVTGIVPQQSAITRSNTSVAPLSSNSSSYLFHPTPVINHLSLPTNSNSSATIGNSGFHHSIYGKNHFNGKNSKHHGGYCNYSDYKRNIISCT
jgi:hypothetical protein